jgi:hypothetical protein
MGRVGSKWIMGLGRLVRELRALISLLELGDIGEFSSCRDKRKGKKLITIRCVGESYAYLQLSVILSYVVRNFHLKMENKEFPVPNYQVSCRQQGLCMQR